MASLTSVQRFQSTPPARGATPRPCCSPWAATHFNPRPPRGGRPITVCSCPTRRLFQSTPPARGATVINHRIADLENISIHAPREGGDAGRHGCPSALSNFNPRPPRGGRPIVGSSSTIGSKFQSTPPARGATALSSSEISQQVISIHAPREGGDRHLGQAAGTVKYFNPRPPRGGRRACDGGGCFISYFNPRPPRGGRLGAEHDLCPLLHISIHAPREGGDQYTTYPMTFCVGFQSTPPARGATAKMHSFTCGSLTNK